jgi:hypothetical protein
MDPDPDPDPEHWQLVHIITAKQSWTQNRYFVNSYL